MTSPFRPAELVERIVDATRPYEFDTFVLGFSRPPAYDRDEHEAVFRPLKIAVGEALVERWPERSIDFRRPELRVDVAADGALSLRPAPLCVAGRYRKLSRSVPASRWIHHECDGEGCESCSYSGTLCGPSLEELLGDEVRRRADGSAVFFHGLGREDTDARMLGTGRPFVLEVREPRRRRLDWRAIELVVDDLRPDLFRIAHLAPVEASAITDLKETAADKTYRAWIEVGGPLPPDAAQRVESLAGVTLAQYSPTRVARRRGRDVCRHRSVLESTWLGPIDDLWVWEVRAESGTYIKELVSGDAGRTSPSVAELLGVEARCRHLDVLAIHWQPWSERSAPCEGADGSSS